MSSGLSLGRRTVGGRDYDGVGVSLLHKVQLMIDRTPYFHM